MGTVIQNVTPETVLKSKSIVRIFFGNTFLELEFLNGTFSKL